MRLTDEEKTMLEGEQGLAVQKAMELLVKYGDIVGAENFVDTNSVSSGVRFGKFLGTDPDADPFKAYFCEIHLDYPKAIPIPQVKASSCTILQQMDPRLWQIQGVSKDDYEFASRIEKSCHRIGFTPTYTCAPYLVGYIPVKGQHCAWMESSAVPICNSVFGARTNTEGYESAGAAMLTGKIPNWGYHLDENRLGHYLVEVEYPVADSVDWGLLGYHTGWIVQEKIPVFNGVRQPPDLRRLMYCSAAAASSGGVEMFHIAGITPEAATVQSAFGKNKPWETLKFGREERRKAYEMLQTATTSDVDFVMLGCPHYSLEEVWRVAMMLEGKHINTNTHLWVFTPRAIKAMADCAGYTGIIEAAGGYLMTDTCPCVSHLAPKGVKTAALDSPKQAHHMHSIFDLDTWYGSTEECVRAALTGKWEGKLT